MPICFKDIVGNFALQIASNSLLVDCWLLRNLHSCSTSLKRFICFLSVSYAYHIVLLWMRYYSLEKCVGDNSSSSVWGIIVFILLDFLELHQISGKHKNAIGLKIWATMTAANYKIFRNNQQFSLHFPSTEINIMGLKVH